MEPGKCRTAHSDPTPGCSSFRVGSLRSTSLPHSRYIGGSSGPACAVSEGQARAPQTISLAHKNRQTRLCDSVCPTSSQVQGHSVHDCAEPGCSRLASRDRGPTGKGHDRASPSSRYEVGVLQPLLHCLQERRWVTTNLGPACPESGPSQAPIQDVDTEMHFSMHPSSRLVCSDRPEGRVLSYLDPPFTQAFLRLVSRTDAPRDSPTLAYSSEEGSPFSERGYSLAPAPRPVEPPRVVSGLDAEVLGGLPPVVNTITSARAPSTRLAYTLKWNLFVDWCSSRREDPRRCSIAVMLSFLQEGLERSLFPSTLKVYVAAIAAHHKVVDGKSVGKHNLVIRFLRGERRLNPPRPHLVPSWDLPSVLSALKEEPFESLQSVELKYLSLKTVLLTALASVKRVGDLQAFSVDDTCLEFGPADSHIVLRPRPGYVPKVLNTPFRDQVVNFQALEEADPAIALLCPFCALRIYVDHTQSYRTSDQLFVCFGGQQKGKAVSKQRLAHWIVEAIALAYQAQHLPCPLGVRAHATRGVASSWALARGASIAESVELPAGRHLIHLRDSIISV